MLFTQPFQRTLLRACSSMKGPKWTVACGRAGARQATATPSEEVAVSTTAAEIEAATSRNIVMASLAPVSVADQTDLDAVREAAEQEDAGAQSEFGVMYEAGRDVPHPLEAVRCARLAQVASRAQGENLCPRGAINARHACGSAQRAEPANPP